MITTVANSKGAKCFRCGKPEHKRRGRRKEVSPGVTPVSQVDKQARAAGMRSNGEERQAPGGALVTCNVINESETASEKAAESITGKTHGGDRETHCDGLERHYGEILREGLR